MLESHRISSSQYAGKTSLIKALAQYTGRSIVNVPLARVTTNAALMSIFYDPRRFVEGNQVAVKMGFKDLIFVMEDVDAASHIVKRRDGKKTATVTQTAQIELPSPKSLWHMLLESTAEECKQLVEYLTENSEVLKKEALNAKIVTSLARHAVSFPGLNLVGAASEDPAVQCMETEAVAAVTTAIENIDTLDRYLGKYATAILNRLNQGTPIDESLVNELLGKSSAGSATRLNAVRDIHYSLYAEDTIPTLEPEDNRKSFSRSFVESGLGIDTERIAPSSTDNVVVVAKEGETKNDSKTDSPFVRYLNAKDKLNLNGLLNVLDGVVDVSLLLTGRPGCSTPWKLRFLIVFHAKNSHSLPSSPQVTGTYSNYDNESRGPTRSRVDSSRTHRQEDTPGLHGGTGCHLDVGTLLPDPT